MLASDRRIPSLDGLRAISITLVLLEHIASRGGTRDVGAHGAVLLTGNAQTGVSIFFVISGYLITKLLLGELDATGTISLSRFYVRRAFRILPAFYFFLGSLVLLAAIGLIVINRRDVFVAALFVWNYVPNNSPWAESWWVGHTWSLSVEEQFYLGWPLALLMLGRKRARWLCVCIIFAEPVIRVGTYYLFPSERGRIGMMLHTRLDTLMFGCGLALIEGTAILARLWRLLIRVRFPLLGTFYILLAVPLLTRTFRGAYSITIGPTLEGLAIASVIYWVVCNADTLVGKTLNSRVVVHVGVISYSLYLWQQLFTASSDWWAGYASPLFIVAGTLAAAECSYWLVEQPMLRMRSKLTKQWTHQRPAGEQQVAASAADAENAPNKGWAGSALRIEQR